MLFNITLEGDLELVAALEAMPGSVRAMLSTTVERLAIGLRAHIVADKLAGQVLNRITGSLAASIKEEAPVVEGNSVLGIVYSSGDVKYAGVHEYGRTVSRVSSRGKPFTVTYPVRSFLRSSLADQREDISAALQRAVMDGLRAPLGAPA